MLIRIAVAFILSIFVPCIGAKDQKIGNGFNGLQPICQSPLVSQSSDLAEADRLTISVVKLYKEGKYSEALTPAKRVLEIREKALGVDHPLVADALINVAELYIVQGKYSDALPLYRRAVKNYETRQSADDQNLARLLDKLASLYAAEGDLEPSESLYKRALEIREKQLGQDHPDVGKSLFKLGRFYRLARKYDQAVPLFLRAIAIYAQKPQPNESAYLDTLEEYSISLNLLGRHDDALEVSKQILRIRNPTLSNKSSEIYIGRAVSLPKPAYPSSLRGTRASGVIIVRVTIDEQGNVILARAEGGPTAFIKAVENSAQKAHFEPTLMGGIPVKITGIITYNFIGQ